MLFCCAKVDVDTAAGSTAVVVVVVNVAVPSFPVCDLHLLSLLYTMAISSCFCVLWRSAFHFLLKVCSQLVHL